MGRIRAKWICQECGYSTSKQLGKCSECGTWNSMVEELYEEEPAGAAKKGFATRLNTGFGGVSPADSVGPVGLDAIEINNETLDASRLSTGLAGLDEVLGGGLVPGSVVLLAGDPGIGKSTLLLQVANYVAAKQKILYVSGEESASQVKLRASRLGIKHPHILVDSEQDVSKIRDRMLSAEVKVAIIDSIQSMYHPQIGSAPGSVSQVREGAQFIVSAAKSQNIATILVGHVTKDGTIAGPRVLEHMVDVVLQFEGDRARQLRILKAAKNRFGSTQEIAIYTMTTSGLAEVDNPSALLLGDRLSKLGRKQAPSGTAVIAGGEGSRSLLLEVQALVGNTHYPSPRRVVNGWDYNRLLQVLAVLEKKVGLAVSRYDVYVNIVGGLDFNDPSGDLGISVAVATSFLDRSIDPGLLCIGELGLTGEIRAVVSLEQRLKEAAKMGFHKALVPKANLPLECKIENMDVIGVDSLLDALTHSIPGAELGVKPASRESKSPVPPAETSTAR
ncbi:MAG: DNA repair protein RadA [Cyanobacteria bacterium SZAS-4]|nr:DNA repair protein RadA [Cyanobacteria bacterium SZAS-4]